MVDLSTNYLGFKLKNPFIASASPLSFDIDNIKRMEDSGISGIVLYSLFEEHLEDEKFKQQSTFANKIDSPKESDGSTTEEYLKHIQKAKKTVGIPIIASLNGCTPGGWTRIAKLIEEAGADAIELNIYEVPTDTTVTGREMEEDYYETFWQVRTNVKIPLALKLSPFFSNLAYNAKRFDEMGANSLVLFNRFYQPDFDIEKLTIKTQMPLSMNQDLLLPLRWIAILFGKVKCNLAGTSGVHSSTDVIKLLLAGANCSMLCSLLLKKGVEEIKIIEREMLEWMERNSFNSVSEFIGKMSQRNFPDNYGIEREEYIKSIRSLKMRTK